MSRPSTPPLSAGFSWKPVAILTSATLACLLPFTGKAFHIDDPVFIWIARQIQAHPADFFGFTINWTGSEIPMYDLATNPPINSYFIAAAAYFFGWSETALHLVFLAPAIATVLGTWYLAQSICSRPLLAAGAALATPVFLVSATNVMCDTLMLAFWVWSVAFWMRGTAKESQPLFFLSSGLAALAAMTKFFAISLVPLLFVYSLAHKRRLAGEQFFLLIPAVFIGAYEWITQAMYGKGLFSSAMTYAGSVGSLLSEPFFFQGMIGLSFTGGCLAVLLFFLIAVESRRVLLGAFSILIFLIALTPFTLPGVSFADINFPGVFQFNIFIVGGLGLLALAGWDFWKVKDSASLLLLLWVIGTFVFAAYVNWSVNSRSLLPMVPAMGILLARRIDALASFSPEQAFWRWTWPVIPSAILALLVSGSDYTMANCIRDAAKEFSREYAPGPQSLWFDGHWGFHYYMQEAGGKPVLAGQNDFQAGDIVVVPSNNPGTFKATAKEHESQWVRRFEKPSLSWLATMNRSVGAGFYSHKWGPLPFAFGKVAAEQFFILKF